MSLLTVHGVSVAFGGPPVLDGVDLAVESGERLALLGRNGCGKSTLLRALAGAIDPDEGEIRLASGRRLGVLPQEVPRGLRGEIFDVVAGGAAEQGALLAEHHRLSLLLAEGAEGAAERLDEVHRRLDASGGWQLQQRVETVISRLQLPARGTFETLSGGLQRRVLLGRALAAEPDVLLLDEPTNHLDIEAIEWLEGMLRSWTGALIVVTHDRAFLRAIATRILELDRGQLRDHPGDYARYLEAAQHRLAVEAEHRAKFDKKLAQEEAWIRQGIKARRTRNEGRVRALEKLREKARERRRVQGRARVQLEDAEASGKRVLVAKNLEFAYRAAGAAADSEEGGDDARARPIVSGLSTILCRGDKVGILGPNGSGKTTLLRLLLGDLEPQSGTVRPGTRLEIAYFDQHRDSLDEARTVADNVAEGADKVTIGGKTRHVISYLESFLFTPAQTRGPISALSGGERNRLLLARLFTRSFNLLVMDEPTNDLDVETLELLESLLVEFEGTLLLVSHDRAFLDNVVTSTLVMEGGGRVGEYAGGYEDWLLQRPQPEAPPKPKKKAAPAKPAAAASESPGDAKPRKLSYREKKDLEALPARIEALEEEQGALHERLADPEIYRRDGGGEVQEAQARLAAVDSELETAYERWAELEEAAAALAR
ncbi:MAG: ATP-binding cassette domain-containing protein [Acidobacteriota bacterium]